MLQYALIEAVKDEEVVCFEENHVLALILSSFEKMKRSAIMRNTVYAITLAPNNTIQFCLYASINIIKNAM